MRSRTCSGLACRNSDTGSRSPAVPARGGAIPAAAPSPRRGGRSCRPAAAAGVPGRQPSVAHARHGIRERDEIGVVRDHDGCHAELVRDLPQQPDDRLAAVVVKGRRRLVHEQHGRVPMSARAMLTRWRWPPESWWGRFARACPRPTRSSSAAARSAAARAAPPRRRCGDHQLLHRGEGGQEIGLLEDDADLVPAQCGAAGVGQPAGVLVRRSPPGRRRAGRGWRRRPAGRTFRTPRGRSGTRTPPRWTLRLTSSSALRVPSPSGYSRVTLTRFRAELFRVSS